MPDFTISATGTNFSLSGVATASSTGGNNYQIQSLTGTSNGVNITELTGAPSTLALSPDFGYYVAHLSYVTNDGSTPTGETFNIDNLGPTSYQESDSNGGSSFPSLTVAPVTCFVSGTRIATVRGHVLVEHLSVDDRIVTASGTDRPVIWIGHRTISCRKHPEPADVRPIRIAAHAFGPGRPARDLYVSPGHAIGVTAVDEVLIPAFALVNGSTIAQAEVDEVTYWHVELDVHDVLLAENLPAESYLDMGNRDFFADSASVLLAGVPDAAPHENAGFCRPLVAAGAMLDFVRGRLDARARSLGWTPSTDTGLQLLVDGRVVDPLEAGNAALFVFPATACDVRVRSKTFVPAALGLGDRRALGLEVNGLSLSGSRGESRRVALDDPRLSDGWHAEEAADERSWRWTRGDLVLVPDLWHGLDGQISLLVSCDRATVRGWTAPADAAAADAISPKLRAVA